MAPSELSGSGGLPLPAEGARMIRTVPSLPGERGILTSTRSKARRSALELLFEAEQKGINAGTLLDDRVAHPTTQSPLRDYTVEIVRGVVANWGAVNDVLATYSRGWALDRMPAVDRAILRVGAWEILHNDDVPDAVAVSEAADLATALSTDSSPAFVSGLLSRVAELHRSAPGSPAAGPSDGGPSAAEAVETADEVVATDGATDAADIADPADVADPADAADRTTASHDDGEPGTREQPEPREAP